MLLIVVAMVAVPSLAPGAFTHSPPHISLPSLQRMMPHVRQHQLAESSLVHPWAAPAHPRSSEVAAAVVKRVPMPAVAVQQAAAPSSCLRLGAGGLRRACGDGEAIRKPAEPGGGREARVTAAPIRCPQHDQRI